MTPEQTQTQKEALLSQMEKIDLAMKQNNALLAEAMDRRMKYQQRVMSATTNTVVSEWKRPYGRSYSDGLETTGGFPNVFIVLPALSRTFRMIALMFEEIFRGLVIVFRSGGLRVFARAYLATFVVIGIGMATSSSSGVSWPLAFLIAGVVALFSTFLYWVQWMETYRPAAVEARAREKLREQERHELAVERSWKWLDSHFDAQMNGADPAEACVSADEALELWDREREEARKAERAKSPPRDPRKPRNRPSRNRARKVVIASAGYVTGEKASPVGLCSICSGAGAYYNGSDWGETCVKCHRAHDKIGTTKKGFG